MGGIMQELKGNQGLVDSYPVHDSIRGQFAFDLFKLMLKDKNIFLLTGGLGYKMFDMHKDYCSNRFINCEAREQAMLDMAVGLAYEGKKVFVYSITPFLIYRPFETIRTYIDHEGLDVVLVGSGRDKDYAHDGYSHDASDVKSILDTQYNIAQFYPETKHEVMIDMKKIMMRKGASFLSLKR